jgi:hypothetical protein
MGWEHYAQQPASIPTGPAEAVDQVVSTMNYLRSQADDFSAQASAILESLQGIEIDDPGVVPEVTIPRTDAVIDWPTPDSIDIELGDLSGVVPEVPPTEAINTSVSFVTPEFTPSVSDIFIPDAPAPIDTSGVPARPAINTAVELPATPSFDMPAMDSLVDIVIPSFTAPTLPTFTDTAPVFSDAAPSVLVNWTEPAYASENFDEVKAVIQRMFAGGTGLPPVIEQQMFDRARGRLDITARKSVVEAFDTFANKGFTMPPGMLVEQVNAAREDNQLAANAQERDIRVLVAEKEIENMRFAVQQGLAAENIIFNIFNNAALRGFEAAKFTVEAQITLFNAKVSLFNALTGAYQTNAQVYKYKLDAELAALDVYRLQLEGAKLTGDINLQKVQVYNARVQALMSQVEIFKAQMDGARVQADVARTQIEGYRADVQAYAERIGAEKSRFDAYKTQVEGEVAKVGVYDAQARVFASLVAAEAAKADVRVKSIQADIEKMQAVTQRFTASVDRSKADLQGKLGLVEAKARTAGLNIQFMSAQSDANRAKSEATIRIGEQQLQTNLALAQSLIKRYEVMLEKAVKEADLKARSMQAAGQMASTLAGGAMAAQHVQASISSSAGESVSTSRSWQESGQENWSYNVDRS